MTATVEVVSGDGVDGSLAAYLSEVHAGWLGDDTTPSWQELDGTLVFADVSGFTPLTERLARLGKVGGEDLTGILNRVFTTLLGTAAGFGGDLLKFGGDALLLLFRGDGHAGRACAAASAMQRGLRPFRRFRTDAGFASLRMSVGVTSGPVQLFLVGTSHRELLAAGPTISAVAELEVAADADEILLGPATAAALDPSHLGDDKAGGVLLRTAPPLAPVDPGPAAHVDRSVLGIPVGLREHLQAPREDGEHRVAVLTFLEFNGTDDILAEHGPGAVADVLHELVCTVQAACERHLTCFLATDLDRNGGKILLVAGAPQALGEEEDRMLHTLLEVVRTPMTLVVRAGVNRGRAFAVDVGSPTRRTYAVVGDATNVAARVAGRADPGTIVATAAVLDHVSAEYDITPLDPFMVKGKSLPIDAAVVGAALGRRRRHPRDVPPVGRDEELAVLRGALEAARTGRGRVVAVVGEAGIGKSRLLSEFRAMAGDGPVIALEGAPYAVCNPYFALRAPLRRLLGIDRVSPDHEILTALSAWVKVGAPALEPWLPLLGLTFGIELPDTPETAELDPAFRAPKLHSVISEMLRLALPGFLAITIEDAHWLDSATSDLLAHVLADVGAQPWAVCITRRDVEGGLPVESLSDTEVLLLGPLREESARIMLRNALESSPLSATAMTTLVARSGGHPLFLQELLRATQEGGAVAELPDTIEALIGARIDTLPTGDRALLRHAAVLGDRFPVDLLGAMLGEQREALDAVLVRLEGFLLRPEPATLQFRHALLREVAYENLPFARRRELHGRAGDLIERTAAGDVEDWCELLSLHYSKAQRIEEAWRFSRIAGDRARRQSAPADAVIFYERAVDAARHLKDRSPAETATVFEALGDVEELIGHYKRAAAAYRKARSLARHEPLMHVDLMRKEGWVRERSGRYSDALRWYTCADAVLAEQAPEESVRRAHTRLSLASGIARLRQGRYRDGISLLESAAATSAALGDLPTLAHAYFALHWAHSDLGSKDSHKYETLALPIYETLGDLGGQGNVLGGLGIEAYYEGRWDQALELYERARDAFRRCGNTAQIGAVTSNIAEIASDRGHLDEAEELFREALLIWQGASWALGIPLATSNLGRVDVRRGDLEDAAPRFAEAREAFRAIGAQSYVLETDAREAERLVLAGRHEEALRLIDETAAGASKLGAMALLLAMLDRLAGCALAQRGDVEAALARLQSSLDRARSADARYEVALTLDALARVGATLGHPGAAGHAEEAAVLFGRLGVVALPSVPVTLDDSVSAVGAGA